MACAQQLARAGHDVDLFEKNDRVGGLLRYGIPDFKMEKHIIDRRMAQMQAEGVTFHTGTDIGGNKPAKELLDEFDAVVLTGGSEHSRDLPVPGRDLDGVHFAMTFLPQQNKRNAGDTVDPSLAISATGKHVIVIGGGDTGSDCIGTSFRQGALSVTQLEILPQPPEKENKALTWPDWPNKMRTSSSQDEGAVRDWSVATRSVEGEDGKVTAINCIRLDWKQDEPVSGRWKRLRQRIPAEGRPGAAGDGLCTSRARRHAAGTRRGPGCTRQRAGRHAGNTAHRWTRCSRPVTCAVASHWLSGPSARGVSVRAPWMSI